MEKGKYQVRSYICEKHGETGFIQLDENSVTCSKCYAEVLDKGREQVRERTKVKEVEIMKKSKDLRKLRTVFVGIGEELVVEKWEKIMSVSNLIEYGGQGYVVLLGHQELLPESFPGYDVNPSCDGACDD